MKRWMLIGFLAALVLAGCGTSPGNGQTGVSCTRAKVVLNLNTGYDQYANAQLPVGQTDNEWWVTVDPTPGATVPRQAHVTGLTFNNNQVPLIPPANARFISTNPNGYAYNDPNNPSPTPIIYEYTYYFTLPNGASNVSLNLKLTADDAIDGVRLNNNVLWTFSSSNPGNMLTDFVSISDNTPSHFLYGAQLNVLKVRVRDTYRSTTGLLALGTVEYTDCCREPIAKRAGFKDLTFWESTGSLTPYTLGLPQLTAKLTSLNASSNDFQGASGEYYDVFFSDWDGTFNPNGAYVTVEAVYNQQSPNGGGLNIARVDLNTTSGSIFADSLISFVGLGDNYIPTDVIKAVDGLLTTDTTMGNTVNQGNRRLRITLAFPCCNP